MKRGFKLFNARVVRGLKGKNSLDVGKVGKAQHYSEYLAKEVLPTLVGFNALTGVPRLIAFSDEEKLPKLTEHQGVGLPGDPRIRFTDVATVGYHVLFKVNYGKVGQYQTAAAVDPDDDTDIDDAAASRMYRCCLLLPATGTRGVLAVENIGGATPAHLIPRWLKRGSYEVANKTTPPEQIYSLAAHGVVDLDRLRHMLTEENQARIHLEKKTVSGSGKRRSKKIVLEEYIRTATERENVLTYAQMMLGLGDEAAGNGLAQLVELVDENVGEVGFDDGYIAFESKTDGTKKIGPNHMDQVFVYAVSAAAATDDDIWLDEVKGVVAGLMTTLEVNLDLT